MGTERIDINTEMIEDILVEDTFYQNRKKIFCSREDCDMTIAVLSYTRLEKTKECVTSILKYTKDIDYILMLIDNGSPEEETIPFFESVPYEKKQIVHITKNISGSLGMNEVLSYIKTKYVVVQGNDTVVTANWLDNMLACMKSDDRIGLVAPLATNTVENQMPDIPPYSSVEELQEIAQRFNISDPKKWEQRFRIIPNSALFRMEIFDTVGKYDCGFFHEFTEDDYEARLRRNGYKLMLCNDTFVHHNHPFSERNDLDVRQKATVAGKNNYKDKYYGVDAWEDIENHILDHVKCIQEVSSEPKKILGIHVKCGTPILDVKYRYRQLGIFECTCHALTSDIKYHMDLQTICDKVVHDTTSHLKLHFLENEYDCVVTETPVNLSDNPLQLIENMISMLKPNGYLIFPLRNNYDLRTYVNLFGMNNLMDNDMPVQIHYSKVFERLHNLSVKKISIGYTLHNIDLEYADVIRRFYTNTGLTEAPDEEFDKLLINDYWFYVKK